MKLRKMICCAICVLCMFALISCAAQPPSNDGGSTAQSTEKTDISFHWNTEFLPIGLDPRGTMPKIQRLTYDSDKNLVDNALQRHGACDALNCGILEGETECGRVRKIKRIAYPEEFFQENTLLLIDYGIATDPFEMSDVSCDGNVLTCTITYYGKPPGSVENAGGPFWTILVELDTVLPEGMEFAVKTNVVILEEEERLEKSNAFYKEYLE